MKLTRKKWKIRTEVIKTHVIEYIMGVFLNVANISVWVTDYLFNNNNICRQFIFDIFLILFMCSKSNKRNKLPLLIKMSLGYVQTVNSLRIEVPIL